ncbi:hypothetical protein BYT27DRAFT_7336480 [Phlegmacium glaucopus]|nr:hypothetical protein BYT27DRAFT_7336480 [Phlegmacium glaucopus]
MLSRRNEGFNKNISCWRPNTCRTIKHIRGLQCSLVLTTSLCISRRCGSRRVKSSRERSRLIEQINGSLELASEYETAKKAQERATENATSNFTKRRGIAVEIKQYGEQKSEADTDLIHYVKNGTYLKNKDLGDLRQERSIHEKAPESVPADQVKVRTTVMRKEENGQNAAKSFR